MTKNIGTKHLHPGLINSGDDRPQDTVIWRNIESDNLLLVNCSDEIDDDPATNQSDTESMNDYFPTFSPVRTMTNIFPHVSCIQVTELLKRIGTRQGLRPHNKYLPPGFAP
jgi:hypothetical protein